MSIEATRDPAAALLALMIQSRGTQCDNARNEVNHAHQLLEDARQEIKAAMERAAEAQENAGFWGDVSNLFGGDIACIAEVVATAALVVASGPGAPAILGLVAAGMSLGAKAGEELGLDPKVCLALGVAASLTGIAAGQLTPQAGVWLEVARGARTVGGASRAGGGGASIAASTYEGDAVDARAEAVSARGKQSAAELRFDLALRQLEQAARDIQRGAAGAANAVRNETDGRFAILARIGAM